MKDSSNVMTKSGTRGQKKVCSTGKDASSMGDTGTSSLNPKMGGNKTNMSHSL